MPGYAERPASLRTIERLHNRHFFLQRQLASGATTPSEGGRWGREWHRVVCRL